MALILLKKFDRIAGLQITAACGCFLQAFSQNGCGDVGRPSVARLSEAIVVANTNYETSLFLTGKIINLLKPG